MQIALSSKAIRHADELAMTRARLPSMDLMETAGRETALYTHSHLMKSNVSRVSIVCGTGNNGGDGFVIARYLHELGHSVEVLTYGDESKYSSDTATNFRKIKKIASSSGNSIDVREITNPDDLFSSHPDCIIDALLGTGLEQDLRPQLRAVVDTINNTGALKVGVDIPTGLNATTGAVLGAAVTCDLTVTMAALKYGLLIGKGPDVAGTIHVIDIGIPETLIKEAGEAFGMALVPEDDDIAARMPRHSRDQHKYSVGVLGITGGSTGLTGAPLMASLAAHRCGVGAVICATPEDVEPIIAGESHETMTVPLPVDDYGLAVDGLKKARDGFSKATVLLVGPGLGRKDGTRRFVRSLLQTWANGAVLDADAFTAISEDRDAILNSSNGRFVLTPHDGEFKLLATLGDDRIDTVRRFASHTNTTLVLKGDPTLVGSPDGQVFISTAGSGCFKKAGFGDVLAGMTGGLYAQGLSPVDAVLCALHLGGRAAERFTSTRSKLSFMPSDLISELPAVIYDFEN